METRGSADIVGMSVFSRDGRELGKIESLQIDVESWTVVALDVRLRTTVLEELGFDRPLLGSQTVWMKVGEISDVADKAVLKRTTNDALYLANPPFDAAVGRRQPTS